MSAAYAVSLLCAAPYRKLLGLMLNILSPKECKKCLSGEKHANVATVTVQSGLWKESTLGTRNKLLPSN